MRGINSGVAFRNRIKKADEESLQSDVQRVQKIELEGGTTPAVSDHRVYCLIWIYNTSFPDRTDLKPDPEARNRTGIKSRSQIAPTDCERHRTDL